MNLGKRTWDASICCDSWRLNGAEEVMLSENRLPFLNPFIPDEVGNIFSIPILEKTSGFIDSCPDWNDKGVPTLLENWLCALEKSKVGRWPALKDDALHDCNIIGTTPSLISLICSSKPVPIECLWREALLDVLAFVASCLFFLRSHLFHSISSLLRLKPNVCSLLEQLPSALQSSSGSTSESLTTLVSSVRKKTNTSNILNHEENTVRQCVMEYFAVKLNEPSYY